LGIFLLDANVLIALAWPEHVAHEKTGRWFARHSTSGWATCPFTEAAFVRTLSNPTFSPKALTPQNALAVLTENLELPGHRFWPADLPIAEATRSIRHRLTGHRQLTDAYLIALAIRHRARLATLDKAIASWAPSGSVEVID